MLPSHRFFLSVPYVTAVIDLPFHKYFVVMKINSTELAEHCSQYIEGFLHAQITSVQQVFSVERVLEVSIQLWLA